MVSEGMDAPGWYIFNNLNEHVHVGRGSSSSLLQLKSKDYNWFYAYEGNPAKTDIVCEAQ